MYETRNQTLSLLSDNDEWQRRYSKYLEDIWKTKTML